MGMAMVLLLWPLVRVFSLTGSRTKLGSPCLKSEWWGPNAKRLRSISVAAALPTLLVCSLGPAGSCLEAASRLAAWCPVHAAVSVQTVYPSAHYNDMKMEHERMLSSE
jgi:hypothetical protein